MLRYSGKLNEKCTAPSRTQTLDLQPKTLPNEPEATVTIWEQQHSAPLAMNGYRLLKFRQTLSQCFAQWFPSMIPPRWAPRRNTLGKKCAAATRIRVSDLLPLLYQMSYRGHYENCYGISIIPLTLSMVDILLLKCSEMLCLTNITPAVKWLCKQLLFGCHKLYTVKKQKPWKQKVTSNVLNWL